MPSKCEEGILSLMKRYVVLLRGINVGGKNKISMAALKECLQKEGFEQVIPYIQSGNIIVSSNLKKIEIGPLIERLLIKNFKLDSELIKVLVLSHEQLKRVITSKPKGFGEQPERYHSDVIFLMDLSVDEALIVFNPKEGVDIIWPGEEVIYSQRLSELRTKSRLNKIIGTPVYKSMTIRNWNTTMKLLELMEAREG